MSKDAGDGIDFERLWSGRQEKRPEPQRSAERVRQAAEKVLPLVRPDDRTYKPFDIRERTDCLHIHCAAQPSHYPSYHYLMNVIFDHDFQSAFTLIYSFMAVEVTGRNLGPVVHAISFRNCECIREYHKKLYDSPAEDEPVIESVTFLAGAGSKATDKASLPTES